MAVTLLSRLRLWTLNVVAYWELLQQGAVSEISNNSNEKRKQHTDFRSMICIEFVEVRRFQSEISSFS